MAYLTMAYDEMDIPLQRPLQRRPNSSWPRLAAIVTCLAICNESFQLGRNCPMRFELRFWQSSMLSPVENGGADRGLGRLGRTHPEVHVSISQQSGEDCQHV